jgi:hypothetical protein
MFATRTKILEILMMAFLLTHSGPLRYFAAALHPGYLSRSSKVNFAGVVRMVKPSMEAALAEHAK